MKHYNTRLKLPSGLAGSYAPDDGCDPRWDPPASREAGLGRGGSDRRKLRQLCAQVHRTLSVSWPEHSLPLQCSSVSQVIPAPNAHNLLVLVHCNRPADEISDRTLLDELHAATPRLRHEVARDIHRKRVPRLDFTILPRSRCHATHTANACSE